MTALDQIRLHLTTSDAAARAAENQGEWTVDQTRGRYSCDIFHPYTPEEKAASPKYDGEHVVLGGGLTPGDALHIATHSPAAILRMNAVVLELVEACAKECAKFRFPDEDRPILHAALQRAAERLQPAPAGKEAGV